MSQKKTFSKLREEIGGAVSASSGINTASSGAIDGIGNGPRGEPPGPRKPKKTKVFVRRKPQE